MAAKVSARRSASRGQTTDFNRPRRRSLASRSGNQACRYARSEATAIGSEGRRVYTLRVEAPMHSILTALTRQTGLTLVWQQREIEAAGIDVQQVVKLDVQEAPLEDLIAQLLKPTGCLCARRAAGDGCTREKIKHTSYG